MDTTGKLAPGIVGITICLILVLAVALPVINSMVAEIDVRGASGTNPVSTEQGLTRYDGPAEWHYADGQVSMGEGAAQTLDGWVMFTDSMVVQPITDQSNNPVLRVFKGYGGDLQIFGSADISFDGHSLTVSGTQANNPSVSVAIADDTPYVMATYVAAFGQANYGYTDETTMDVALGDGGVIIRPITSGAVRGNENLTGILYYDGRAFSAVDTEDVDLSGLSISMGSTTVSGLAVPTVSGVYKVAEGSETRITGWYAPLTWTYEEKTPAAMAKTVLQILPLILVVALFVLVVRWMQSGTGGQETSAFLGGSKGLRSPNDGWRDKR